MEIDVTYAVQYQRNGREDWFEFTNHQYERSSGHGSETHDLAEAEKAARDLLSREQFIDSRPKYQDRVTATRVVQRISAGGIVLIFGEPI